MNSASKGERRYAEKVEKPSKVLLVCIYDTVVIDITTDLIKAKFEEFGNITKLLIFEKGEVTKLFLEYEQVDQAIKAKNKLDGTKLYQAICKMTIYFSNFTNVEVSHQTNIFSQDNDQNQYFSGKIYSPSHAKKDSSWGHTQFDEPNHLHIDDEDIMQSFNIFGEIKRSKTDSTPALQWQIDKLTQSPTKYRQKPILPKSLNTPQRLWKEKQEEPNIKMKEDTDIRSSVLFFPYSYPLKPKNIYNLFSNFGNISSVTIKKQTVYIKFRSKEFAAMANTYLNGTVLFGNLMDLRECPEIFPCWQIKEGQYSESAYYDLNSDRFTAQRSITINPPANTIHVSSIKRQVCKEHTLMDIFSQYGRIEKIQILPSTADKNMALVKFYSLQDSFSAVADLHNQSFSGRKMQISFTKSKF